LIQPVGFLPVFRFEGGCSSPTHIVDLPSNGVVAHPILSCPKCGNVEAPGADQIAPIPHEQLGRASSGAACLFRSLWLKAEGVQRNVAACIGTAQQVRFYRLSSGGFRQFSQVDGKAPVLVKPERDVGFSGFVNHAV